jgi:hypothetical protein
MFDTGSMARVFVIVGLVIAGIGLLVGLATRIPGLNRLGNLPGDIRYTSPSGGMTCFVPVATSIILSIVLTVVLNLVIRLLNR